jgi:hypothetical protein
MLASATASLSAFGTDAQISHVHNMSGSCTGYHTIVSVALRDHTQQYRNGTYEPRATPPPRQAY